ncbi:D-alanyl-D-alanine carboxypeptidase family protein [Tepidamorphus sp. 3E244]|uniref:D-alanyl-D-alanine carboxypeptidase family protein n=1 Tax=Tepidamorphus sp. 3E244 TaxID=3385498 RepID=UPI0038FBF9F0
MFRTLAAFALALGLAAGLQAQPAKAGPAILVDVDSGEVLFANRAFDRWHPASITKLLTAYLAFDAIRSGRLQPDSPVTMSQNALSNPPSKMGFPVGTRITLSAALKMLIVKSANDIAVAIGETVGGSEPEFVAMMNRTAQRLGMTNSHFENPHGLHHPNQYTTARDMAVLARAIHREFPQYQNLFEIPAIRVGRKTLRSHNRLVGRYPGTTGMKTGYICAGAYNLVASAKRGRTHLIAVVLGAPNGRYRSLVAAHLLENGFDRSRGFFSSSRTTIDSFRGAGREPFDMRPYVCKPRSQRPPLPREIASYGFDVPIVNANDDDDEGEDESDPVGTRGAAAIQVSSGGGRMTRAERIAAYLAGPASGTTVNANGMLAKDELASMSMPRTIPAPMPRMASANRMPAANTPLPGAVAPPPAALVPPPAAAPMTGDAAGLRLSIPVPRRRPVR